MPYISSTDGRRIQLQQRATALTAGELNYQIFSHMKHGFTTVFDAEIKIKAMVKNFLGDQPNYQKYNDMTGALVRCAKEVERRLNVGHQVLLDVLNEYDKEINIYEDKKIIENGDV